MTIFFFFFFIIDFFALQPHSPQNITSLIVIRLCLEEKIHFEKIETLLSSKPLFFLTLKPVLVFFHLCLLTFYLLRIKLDINSFPFSWLNNKSSPTYLIIVTPYSLLLSTILSRLILLIKVFVRLNFKDYRTVKRIIHNSF